MEEVSSSSSSSSAITNTSLVYLAYYKKLTIMSPDARAAVVLPDVKPLPSFVGAKSEEAPTAPVESRLQRAQLDADDEFLAKFEALQLPSWSHNAKIRVIYCYLKRDGRKEGANRVFEHLQRMMKAGFHLSDTYFWIHMVGLHIASYGAQDNFDMFWALKSNKPLQKDDFPYQFYSKQLFLSDKAAAEMVLPDRKQLPSVIKK
jgi:hypothetical protein